MAATISASPLLPKLSAKSSLPPPRSALAVSDGVVFLISSSSSLLRRRRRPCLASAAVFGSSPVVVAASLKGYLFGLTKAWTDVTSLNYWVVRDYYRLVKSVNAVEPHIQRLSDEQHYNAELKDNLVELTEEELAELALETHDLWDEKDPLARFVMNGLKAKELYRRDVQYIVKNGKALIINELTGRVEEKRWWWSDRIHQAVEAKEGLKIEEKEFLRMFQMPVIEVLTNLSNIRKDLPIMAFAAARGKWEYVRQEVEYIFRQGSHVLVGTTRMENSEYLSDLLKEPKIPHNVLNAQSKYAARGAEIVTQAKRKYAIPISTNMVGRGTDIILGGNPKMLAKEITEAKSMISESVEMSQSIDSKELEKLVNEQSEMYPLGPAIALAYLSVLKDCEAQCLNEGFEVKRLGGLHVIGTSLHESRRIDKQLRGRAGRQGDPGSTRFMVRFPIFSSLSSGSSPRFFISTRLGSSFAAGSIIDGIPEPGVRSSFAGVRLEETVEIDSEKVRLDSWISSRVSGISRARVQTSIRLGFVRVNGRVVDKVSQNVKSGDKIDCTISELQALKAEPEDIPLDIVFEDDSVLVVNKPPHMVVHPAPGNASGTLVNGILHHCSLPIVAFSNQDIISDDEDACNNEFHDISMVHSNSAASVRPGIVHRLDKGTSGLLVVAKDEHSHAQLSDQFKLHTIQRVYISLTSGVPSQPSGRIDIPVGRDPNNRIRMAAIPGATNSKQARHAASRYKVIEVLADGGSALVEWRLETGRTHQIRAHAKYLGIPLLGDELYGGTKSMALSLLRPRTPANRHDQLYKLVSRIERPCLHALALGFRHPYTGKNKRFSCPPPTDFARTLNQLRKIGTMKRSA